LIWRIYDFPRINLFGRPTPLEKASNLSRELGVEIYVKRDDVMDLAFGGNKVRKLEYILGEALARGSDVIVTRGSYYSNHVRLTAAAARKLGLDVVIVTYPPQKDIERIEQGNVFLNKLFGAEIIEVNNPREADEKMEEIRRSYEEKGRKPYVIPVGGSTPLGVFGYIDGVYELMEQLRKLGVKPRYIIHATGTGTTQAGIILGLKLLGVRGINVLGIDVEKHEDENRIVDHIYELINEALEILDVKLEISKDEINVVKGYSFGGYGLFNDELIEFIVNIARKEGLVLEPVYTGKAFYALVDLINKKEIKKGDKIIFIHTGGTPLVFQLKKYFEKYL